MRKCYGAIILGALLLAGSTSMAQLPSVGIYFDEDGTQASAILNGGMDEVHMAYVIVFWDALVGGASYSFDFDPRVEIFNISYPPGVAVGHPTDGCGVEYGMTEPGFGFLGKPVVISELTLYTGDEIIYGAMLCVMPHCNYQSVVVSDSMANLYEACSRCAFMTIPVPNEELTWGAVKNMYQ